MLLVNRYTNRYIFINRQKFTKINISGNIYRVEGTEYKSISHYEMTRVSAGEGESWSEAAKGRWSEEERNFL